MKASVVRIPAGSRQRGMTTLGFLILVVFIGLFAFAAIRLTPVYLNYMKVVGVLEGIQQEFDGQNPTREAIRTSINRRFDVESISVLEKRDVKISAESEGFVVAAQYDHTTPYVANVHFTVRFDTRVTVRR